MSTFFNDVRRIALALEKSADELRGLNEKLQRVIDVLPPPEPPGVVGIAARENPPGPR